jgi:hypothetical protein
MKNSITNLNSSDLFADTEIVILLNTIADSAAKATPYIDVYHRTNSPVWDVIWEVSCVGIEEFVRAALKL